MGRKRFYFKLLLLGLIGIIVFFAVYKYGIKRKKDIGKTTEKDFSQVPKLEDNFLYSALNYVKENIWDTGKKETDKEISYFLHKDITSTVFWVGEKASDSNENISNSPSAWDEKWKSHFGGTDTPKDRNEFFPAKFTPKENPFYAALPYNDFDSDGKRKKKALSTIPWAGEKKWKDNESLCKNRWIKIIKSGKIAYAQWEDVGPFEENDAKYVFGKSRPKNKINESAGIDISPAVRDYLGLKGIDKVDWQFVDKGDVPEGPWKKIVTTSDIYWKK